MAIFQVLTKRKTAGTYLPFTLRTQLLCGAQDIPGHTSSKRQILQREDHVRETNVNEMYSSDLAPLCVFMTSAKRVPLESASGLLKSLPNNGVAVRCNICSQGTDEREGVPDHF